MIIGDIMTKNVLTVNEDTPIPEVAEIISRERIHAVPVVDQEGRVSGIITESDFFSKSQSNSTYLPTLIDFLKSGKIKDSEGEASAIRAVVNATAKDIMTSPCVTLNDQTDAQEFIRVVREKGFNTIPVTHVSGKLVGIVTVADMLKFL
jgi:CBS domain-containing protein